MTSAATIDHAAWPHRARHRAIALTVGIALASLGGCGALLTPMPRSPSFYTLDGEDEGNATSSAITPSQGVASAHVVLVALPRASAGFDTDRLLYVRDDHHLEAYADSQWVDTPPRMLAPLISAALTRTGTLEAVLAPRQVDAQWELQSDVIRLQYDVVAARFRFTLRIALVDRRTRAVVLTREFDDSAPVIGANPTSAVAAANAVVATVLREVAAACAGKIDRRD